MAVKQLDFNSPLPSVRRLGSAIPASPISYSDFFERTPVAGLNSAKQECGMQKGPRQSPRRSPLPFYKSDLVSGPIQKPGVVPFSWEQRPGQPKDSIAAGTPASAMENAMVSYSQPIGRGLRQSLHAKKEETRANGLDSTPGRHSPSRSAPLGPHFSAHASTAFSVPSATMYRTILKSLESSREALEKRSARRTLFSKEQTTGEQRSGRKENDRDEKAFPGTPAVLSRAESCFMHYSISGRSEDMELGAPSWRFSKDLQTPNLSTGQSLPSSMAKATFSSRSSTKSSRESMVLLFDNEGEREQPAVGLPRQQIPNPASGYSWVHPKTDSRNGESDEEDDDEDHKYDEQGQLWMKGCGVLPKLWLKTSFCLMNPLQGAKTKVPEILRSAREIYTPSRTAARQNEKPREELSRHKMGRGEQSLRQKGSRVSCESNRLSYGSGSQTSGRSTLPHLPPSSIHGGKSCESPSSLGTDGENIPRLKRKQASASGIPLPESSHCEASSSAERVVLRDSSKVPEIQKCTEDGGKKEGSPLQPHRFTKSLSQSWLSHNLPQPPSKMPTLRSLFRTRLDIDEEEEEEISRVKLRELPKGQMRFADVLARPESEES